MSEDTINPGRWLLDQIKSLAHKRIRIIRFAVQVTFFFVLNGVILGLSRIPFPVPISFPAGSPFGIVFGGLDAIQYILSSGKFPFLAFGVFFLTGSLVGKLFCGWVCPVGLWQDLLSWFPSTKIKLSKPNNEALQGIGQLFLFLALILTGLVGTRQARGENLVTELWTRIPYGVIDPAGTMFITWYYAINWDLFPGDGFFDAMEQLGTLFFVKTLILFLIAAISIAVPRAYCRWICPTGVLLSPFSKHSVLTIKRNPVKCESGCSRCEDVCPMQVPILEEPSSGISNELCINCGNCVDECPDALSFGIRV
ncbi:MAG: 4Fe-4S binding protein [Candidatus Heimdallarchaeota archaeon]|nr:4Fe-4S binding protein [Candidatus Heimdallarchaeota archaeon]